MKKVLSIIIALMLCFVCLGDGMTTTTEDETTTVTEEEMLLTLYVSSASGLNMREKADYSSKKLITLWCGEPVYALGTEGDFTHILCAYGEGYVSSTGLSTTRSKNMEMLMKMYVNLKVSGEKLNVRGIPYLPAEYANEPIDMIDNGTNVLAINQYGSFVEIIYRVNGELRNGFVAESCLAKATDKDVYKDEVCYVCGGALDGRCHLIDDNGENQLVCYNCYMVGVCPKCSGYVYFDQYYALNGKTPTHKWCISDKEDACIYHCGKPVLVAE